MYTEPTAEEAAWHLLDIFRSHKMRAGEMLIREPARTEFLLDRRWHRKDFYVGLQYACQHHLIVTAGPNVITLTETGSVLLQAIGAVVEVTKWLKPLV